MQTRQNSNNITRFEPSATDDEISVDYGVCADTKIGKMDTSTAEPSWTRSASSVHHAAMQK